MSLFKKNTYHIKLFVNAIEIKDISTGITTRETNTVSYNNQRLLIADFETAEKFFKKAILKMKPSLAKSSAVVQQMEMAEGGLSQVEIRILKEIFERVGISEVEIVDSSRL